MKWNSEELIEQCISRINLALKDFEATVLSLSDEQLNWKVSEEIWSVLECIEHMNFTGHHYIPIMEKGIQLARTKAWKNQEEFKSGLIGRYMINSMSPQSGQIKGKMKTFKSIDPIYSKGLDREAIQTFSLQQKQFINLYEAARNVNLQKVRITSLIGNIIRFRLGDCIQFITGHTERHIIQIKNTIKNPQFPQ